MLGSSPEAFAAELLMLSGVYDPLRSTLVTRFSAIKLTTLPKPEDSESWDHQRSCHHALKAKPCKESRVSGSTEGVVEHRVVDVEEGVRPVTVTEHSVPNIRRPSATD